MELNGAFEVARQPEEVLGFLGDLNQMAPCLPDLQESSIESPAEGTVKVKAGVGVVKGVMTIRMRVERQGSGVRFAGRGSGMGSAVDIDAQFEVAPAAAGSRVAWQGGAKISGTLASIGGGLLEPVAKRNVQRLIDRIEQALQG